MPGAGQGWGEAGDVGVIISEEAALASPERAGANDRKSRESVVYYTRDYLFGEKCPGKGSG